MKYVILREPKGALPGDLWEQVGTLDTKDGDVQALLETQTALHGVCHAAQNLDETPRILAEHQDKLERKAAAEREKVKRGF